MPKHQRSNSRIGFADPSRGCGGAAVLKSLRVLPHPRPGEGSNTLPASSFGRRKLVRRESLESWPSRNDPATAREAPCQAALKSHLLLEARISHEGLAGR